MDDQIPDWTPPQNAKEGDWITHPCGKCLVPIEGEWGPSDWFCANCWPLIERGRFTKKVADLEKKVASLEQELKDNAEVVWLRELLSCAMADNPDQTDHHWYVAALDSGVEAPK